MIRRHKLLVCLLGLGFGSVAHAAPLDLVLFDAPDVMAGFIDVQYDAASAQLVASGFALGFDDDGFGDPLPVVGGTFDLVASVDSTGTLSGGSVVIGGTIDALGFDSGTLLTASISAFGFREDGGDPLEFLLDVTGGDAATMYGDVAGIILSQSGFLGSFLGDWDNLMNGIPGSGAGVADIAAVPVPAALWLFLAALASIAGPARRQSVVQKG